MKLGLGTVQFGLKYGVANQGGQVSLSEARAMLECAKSAGIDTLDTAIAYGESEARLGELGVAEWKLITKLPALPNGAARVAPWVKEQIALSMRRLNVKKLEAILLHRPQDLLSSSGKEYVEALKDLKADGSVGALGYSIYDPSELELLWTAFKPDIIQAPLNIFNRRLPASGWLKRLEHEGVRVHARSVFMQGLLLMPPEKLPPYFKPWSVLHDSWWKWCEQHECAPLRVALAFVLQQPGIERVVVGADSRAQLEGIIAAAQDADEIDAPHLECNDENFINPTKWPV